MISYVSYDKVKKSVNDRHDLEFSNTVGETKNTFVSKKKSYNKLQVNVTTL